MLLENLRPSQITFYKMFGSCSLFYKSYASNEGFWKNLVWKIFNFEKFPKSRMKGFSISKHWK